MPESLPSLCVCSPSGRLLRYSKRATAGSRSGVVMREVCAMPRALLDQILTTAGLDPADAAVTFAGADPIFPLALRVGEAGAAAVAATGVAAAELWRLRTGRMQRVHMDVDAGAAAMRSNQYLRREPDEVGEPTANEVRLPGSAGGIYRSR